MLFGFFKGRKSNKVVSQRVVDYLQGRLVASEQALEELAAATLAINDDNDIYKLLYLSAEGQNGRLFETFVKQHNKILEVYAILEQKQFIIESCKALNSDLLDTNRYLRDLNRTLKQDLAASRKACEHMRKTRH